MRINNFLSIGFLALVFNQSCMGQPAASEKWSVELNSKDVGLVRSLLTFEFKDSSFIAYTRKNADRDLLGFWKSSLARIFTGDFEHGSLINITKGRTRQHSDTLFLSAIFRSAMGSYYFRGTMYKGVLQADLLNAKKEVKGSIKGKKTVEFPLPDYQVLAVEALKITEEKIFNKSELATAEWNSFEERIKHVSTKVQDDIEMEFAFFYLASKLPFSHYFLLRPAPESGSDSTLTEKQVYLEERSPGTMYMKIESFSGAGAEMDSAFAYIIRKQCKKLIVDLRNNPGGAVEAGMRFAASVADTSFYGGVFLTQRWFEKSKALPTLKEYQALPVLTEANYDLLIDGIHSQSGLCLKIVPAKTRYSGNLFILTNTATASTCEPIVYGFRQNKRAVIVGEKTAGAMLNGEFFRLKEGFSLMVPTADYYASDGYRIDKQGVEPSIKVKQEEALNYVLSQLIK